MSFRVEDCIIPTIWCGNGSVPTNKKYKGAGTPYKCLQKGFGAGKFTEINKTLPSDSLRQIKYVGEKYEAKLKTAGISTLNELKSFAKKSSKTGIEIILKRAFTNSSKKIDYRAYNSTLEYLYKSKVSKLPQCKKL